MTVTIPAAGEQVGLPSSEAARRLAQDGPNLVPRVRRRSWPARVLGQLRDPMILLLCGALVVVILLGDVSDAVIIAAVVVLNTTIGVVQEVRAENAIAALDRMAAPRARVRRDGRVLDVDAAELVVEDLVRLEAGDVVPADLQLTEAVTLEVDEASMTGESVPVPRKAGGELLSGTVVTRGRGFGTVVRTGADSGLGRIAAALIAQAELRPTPLQRRLSRLSRQLVVVTVLLAGRRAGHVGGTRQHVGGRTHPGGQPGRGGDSRVAPCRGVGGARHGRVPDGAPRCARALAPGRRDARLSLGVGLRQDRDPHRGQDDRAAAVDPRR